MAEHDRKRRRRLGEILVAEGVLSETQLEDALAHQRAEGRRERLGTVIIELELATEDDIASALAAQLGYGTVDLAVTSPEAAALSRVPRKLAERHHALPLRIDEGDVLVVAMSDPTNVVALDDLRLTSNLRAVRPLVAPESAVNAALRRVYGVGDAALDVVDALGGDSEVVSLDEEERDLDDLAQLAEGAGEQPIVRLANAILADAVRTRASDVHVEPGRDHVRVRYRIDGLLREKMRVPRHIGPALISRLKIMSQLDIAERRRPQDGRSMVRVEGQEVDLRVSTMPTMFGETVVLRLLRKGAERLEMDDLGLAPDARTMFEQALARPQGLIIFTGPTGSGKTTSLYAGLTELADPVRNCLTLEDPIEYQLEGVNQTQVNPKIGLSFARGLRTVLRQDPDVVMVGEIRDQETAELAMEASFTGHLVLSTLHTNDAPSTVIRLVDLGVERFLIASSLVLVVAQRLVRVNCPHCKAPYTPDPKVVRMLGVRLEDLEEHELVAGTGCNVCDQTGFVGRTGIYEFLQLTPQMRELIVEGAGETRLARLARAQGMRTLREDGLRTAFAGITTLEEVLRTTPEESTTVDRCPNCSYLVGDDFVVCPNCDTDLGRANCPNCNAPLEPGWSSCPYCKTQIDAPIRAPAAQPVVLPGATAADTEPAAAAPAADATADDPAAGDGEPAAPARKRRKRKSRASSASSDDASDPSPYRVLVVDDDESVCKLVEAMLDEHEVHVAADGTTALELTRELHPDAIVLDYKLPDLDGIEVTRTLRDDDDTRDIAILMITGVADPEVEVEGLLAGVDDFLAKPFDEDVLRMRLRGAVLRSTRAPV